MPISADTYTYSNVNTTDKNSNVSGEGLIERPNSVPVAVAMPLVDVTAPATLPEGYSFEASIGGQSFNVTVPIGKLFWKVD